MNLSYFVRSRSPIQHLLGSIELSSPSYNGGAKQNRRWFKRYVWLLARLQCVVVVVVVLISNIVTHVAIRMRIVLHDILANWVNIKGRMWTHFTLNSTNHVQLVRTERQTKVEIKPLELLHQITSLWSNSNYIPLSLRCKRIEVFRRTSFFFVA